MSERKTSKDQKKQARLRDALRENLHRRKSQSRGRKQANPEQISKNNHK